MTSIWALVACAALATEPGALQKVAVLDVQAPESHEALVPVLTEVLSTELGSSGRFTSVVAGRDIKAMLSFEERKQILGCTDDSCIAEIGGALGADRIVVSSVNKVGTGWVLTLKLIDIVEARTEARVYETIEGSEARLVTAMPRAVGALLGRPKPAQPAPASRLATTAERPLPVGPIALLAVGAAGLGVGLGFGVSAKSHYDAALSAQEVGSQRRISSGQTHQSIANLAFGVSAAAAVGGALWWWLGTSNDGTAQVVPSVGAQAAALSVRGRF